MFYVFILIHISVYIREKYPTRRIRLHGYTASPLPKLLDLLFSSWNTMTKFQDRLIKSIQSEKNEKFIFVAHKDNDKDFF